MFECRKKKECLNHPQRCPSCHACADMMNPYPLFKDRDLVEVVRCKDCNQWKRNIGVTDSPNGHCFYHGIDSNGLDFCSYGEKREATDGPA